MVIFDLGSMTVKRTFPLPPGIHNFLSTPNGSALLAFKPAGHVYRIDPSTGNVQANREIESAVRGLAWTINGDEVIASANGTVLMLGASDLSIHRRFTSQDAKQFFYSSMTPDGRYILAPRCVRRRCDRFESAGGLVSRHIHTGTPLRVMVSPDPNTAYVGNILATADHLTVLNLHTFETRDMANIRDANGSQLACPRIDSDKKLIECRWILHCGLRNRSCNSKQKSDTMGER